MVNKAIYEQVQKTSQESWVSSAGNCVHDNENTVGSYTEEIWHAV